MCHDGRLGAIISVSLIKFKEMEGCVDLTKTVISNQKTVDLRSRLHNAESSDGNLDIKCAGRSSGLYLELMLEA